MFLHKILDLVCVVQSVFPFLFPFCLFPLFSSFGGFCHTPTKQKTHLPLVGQEIPDYFILPSRDLLALQTTNKKRGQEKPTTKMRCVVVVAAFVTLCSLMNVSKALNPSCPFMHPAPLESDSEHPCNMKECEADWYTSECSIGVARFCLETSRTQNDSACQAYSKLCPKIFGRVEKTNENRTAHSRLEPWYPCMDTQCKTDLFSPGCMQSMFRYCTSAAANGTTSAGFCDVLIDLCPFPRSSFGVYREWVCVTRECSTDIRGKECIALMADTCGLIDVDDEKPLLCEAFQDKDGMQDRILAWIVGLANPSADDDYNRKMRLRGKHGSYQHHATNATTHH